MNDDVRRLQQILELRKSGLINDTDDRAILLRVIDEMREGALKGSIAQDRIDSLEARLETKEQVAYRLTELEEEIERLEEYTAKLVTENTQLRKAVEHRITPDVPMSPTGVIISDNSLLRRYRNKRGW